MSEKCQELHALFRKLKRYQFPFNEKEIPQNGIYILFEKGEQAHGGDRIVRIGTHTGKNKLGSRLKEHFTNENKDRSIFRKNIGRALLNRKSDDYLKIWELDLISSENKQKYGHLINKNYQQKIEHEVTKTIQNNFSFVVIEEGDKDKRLYLEAKLISDVSNCTECRSSKRWLGNYSIKEKIRGSGLWQEQGVYKTGFTESEFANFIERYL
ncbi:hypothetical protein [Neobacillus sp. SAB-20_R2A]|uniref:hypothetical protein n=1 Tax=Neobacillus sp. SAB-20_R2A TaxID=3120519 RepID=UPI003C6E07F6